MPSPTITIRVSPELLDRVNAAGKLAEVSVSDFVRQAIEQRLDGVPPDAGLFEPTAEPAPAVPARAAVRRAGAKTKPKRKPRAVPPTGVAGVGDAPHHPKCKCFACQATRNAPTTRAVMR